jgi:hypothetical protein
MNTIIETLHLGQIVQLENAPFSQKHLLDPKFQHYFQGKVTGRIVSLSYDVILLENREECLKFYPIPPLSGDIFCTILSNNKLD